MGKQKSRKENKMLDYISLTNPETDSTQPSNVKNPLDYVNEETIKSLQLANGSDLERGVYNHQLDELNRVVGNPNIESEYTDYTGDLAANQDFSEQLTNTVLGGGVNALAGFMDNFNYDLVDMKDMLTGKEKQYGNWLSEITSDLRKEAGEFQVYQEGSSFADPAYWLNQGKNLAYSGGLITGALLEQAALSYVTAQTLGGGAGLQLASLGNKARLLGNLAFGSFKGIHEGYINGLETFNSTKEKYLSMGYSEEEAMENASKAASLGYKMEVGPLMILNALQFGTIGKYNPFSKKSFGLNQGYSGAVENVTDLLFTGVKNKYAKGAISYGINAASEGLEEGIQTGIGKYAQHETLRNSKDIFTDLELFDDEMTDSIVGGVLGGVLFGGLGDARNAIEKRQVHKRYGHKLDDFINKASDNTTKNLFKLKKAIEEGDQNKIDTIRYKMQKNNVFQALKLDYLNQKETGFETYVSQLKNIADAAKAKDLNKLKELGITDLKDIQYIQNNYENYINDALDIKDNFVKNYDRVNDFFIAAQMSDSQQVMKNATEFQKRNTDNNRIELEGNPIYQNLSSDAKKVLELELEKTSLWLKARKSITKEQKERIGEIDNELKDLKISNNEKAMIHGLNKTNIINNMVDNYQLEDAKLLASERIEHWSKDSNVRKEKLQRAKKKVEKATSKEKLDEAKQDLQEENSLTPEVEEVINDKSEKIEVEETVENTVSPFGEVVTPTEDEINLERNQTASEVNQLLSDDAMIVDHDGLFEPSPVKNLEGDKFDKLTDIIKGYYNNLKEDIGKEPSFEDFIRDFIKQSSKESTDRIFNVLKETWKKNGFKEADYNQVYKNVFNTRKETSIDVLNISEDFLQDEVTTEQELKENTKEVVNEVNKKVAPVIKVDENNRPVLEDANPFKTSTPTLKAAFLSIAYKRDFVNQGDTTLVTETDLSSELNQGDYIDSQKLLNPDKFNEGEKLSVKIPENFREIKVSTWEDDFTKGPSMTFGEWERLNNVEENSKEWLDKVPMIAYDQDGDGVFFIHDTDWYNGVNVGLKKDVKEQGQVISEGRKNVSDLRKQVSAKNNLTIEITEKRPGTWKTINKDEPALTLNEANPQTQLAIANDKGELVLNGKENFETNERVLLNRKQFKRGHIYDVRRSTTSKDYIAFEVLRDKVNKEVATTLQWATKVYLYKNDKEGKVSDPQKIRRIRDNVLNITGYNLFDAADFEAFLNLYIQTVRGKFTDAKDIVNAVNSSSRIGLDTPYIVLQKNNVMFGIKGQKISGTNDILYLHPDKINDKNGNVIMQGMLKKFDTIVSDFTQNTSMQGLNQNKTTVTIDEKGSVKPGKNYREFLKDNLKTSVKSYNIGTEDKPNYATVIQPVINFKQSDVEVKEKVKEVAEKILENKPVTKKEEELAEDNKKEFKEETKKILDNKEKLETYKDALNSLRELGTPESDPSIQYLKGLLEGEDNLFEPIDLDDNFILNIKEKISGTEGLTILQDFQVVDFVFNKVASKLNFDYKSSLNKQKLLEEVKDSYFSLIEPKKEKNASILSNLKIIQSTAPNDNLNALIEKLQNEVRIFDVIKDNWHVIETKALEKIYKYTGIQEVTNKDVLDTNDTVEKEKNYSKSSLEENGKTTASYRLKRFFSNISQVKADGTVRTGFLGVPTYVGFDTVYSTIEQVMSSPYEMDSDYDSLIKRLEENVDNHKWLKQVIDNLTEADEQIKKEFVYNFGGRHTLSMKFVMFSKNRDNTYTLKVYDTNANEITRVIRQGWESNFKQSPLVFVQDGQYRINKVKAKNMLDTFNNWKKLIDEANSDRRNKKTVKLDNKQLKDWLLDFGISLSDETLNELQTKEVSYMTNRGKESMYFNNMFENSSSTAGLFGLLANYLDSIVIKEDTTFEENPENHPFSNANNVLKTLARIESKYAMYATTNSFRDGDKSIYGFTPSKHSTDVVKALKFEQEFRNELGNKSFNKSSYLLDLLNKSESFRDKFFIDHIGITSLKELGKKVFGDNSITSLSNSDHELTKLGLFQDVEQGEISETLGENNFVNIRMGRMFLPTMSDKSQMLDLFTGILDLKNKHFEIEGDNVSMTPQLKDILYSQLVTPELDRLTNFVSTIKSTDIKGYDLAAQMFLMIPELNNIIDEKTGKRVLSLMINEPATYNKEWFEKTQKDKVLNIIQQVVSNEVNNKRNEWLDSGFIKDNNGVKSVEFLNKKYFDRLNGDLNTKIEIALNDYVINSLMTNANSYMLLAGDIALYSQNKIAKHFENGKVYMPKDKSVYSKISKEIIGINVGKRLALMLAPGNKLANSKNEEYVQLFLNDHVDITSNVETLVDMFYGKEEVNKVKETLEKYHSSNDIKFREAIAKDLQNKYPEIADYFDIEATDAQEYNTLSEQIHILYNQGRLSSKEYNSISEKVKKQLEAENKGEKIPSDAILTYSELKLVLQPIKPVHTGFKSQDEFDVMRMMYIKSSSFPLIPQVTKGTYLDDLRRMLEKFESKQSTGRFVRASYQTANKVGAVTNAITPFNPDGTFNTNINEDDLNKASLVLSRDNFRIQQDVPFKSGKRIEDVVSLGTQTLKLLFGDGMLDIEGMKELHQEFNTNYDDYVRLRKNILFNQLGVDEDGQPKDLEKTINLLQSLLKREAEDRGYPKQDVEALELTPILDNSGKVIDMQFSIPLWLSPNSNRYEALLNAIVTNKLVNIKLPGNSYVVGSEAGFKMKTDLSGIDESKVVYTSKYKGELKAYEEGSLTQVMLPSKFRNNKGELIDLSSKKYSYRDENGVLRLKEDMLDKELLNVTSFRIPTSGHVSMAQVEIVGFLPVEVGDLMIVPRNLTKQKGLDFDIDKETTYQLWSSVNKQTGKIEVLNDSHIDEAIEKIQKSEEKKVEELLKKSPLSLVGMMLDLDIQEDLSTQNKIDLIKDKLNQKLLENKLVSIHNKVLSNPSKDVQRKINKVLSMDFAKAQAEFIQSTLEGNVDNTLFTMLSDTYQKDKMALGASGKLGIGVYSNYVVFHSMIQQTEDPIQLLDEDGDALNITIGNQTSDGILGKKESLAPSKIKRSISEIFAERQNTATDNEKEQIMGRVNINELTINVDSLMSALGFDKTTLNDGTEVSIPYLFMSQPIIREYVIEMRKTKSNTAQYDPDAKEKVIGKLKEKYGFADYLSMDKDELQNVYNSLSTLLTGQNLFDNLTESDNNIQLAVLEVFTKLDDYAKKISKIQNRLNINNSGLGKSFFETIDKYYAVNNLQADYDSKILNASKLVGDYREKAELLDSQITELKEQGYLEFPGYLIKANNPVGSMLVNAVHSGYNLWKDYFPYNSGAIPNVTDDILKYISDENTSSQKLVELQQDVFKEMKKYFSSSQKLNIFNGDPQKERYRLFIDGTDKKSLASYLNSLTLDDNFKEILKSNKLTSRLEYDLNQDGKPSLIKYSNSKGENFDEDYLYMSLIELMEKKIKLPDFNGISYNTRKLAQDLVSYSYLEGGIQEAIQFIKYIPVAYLNAIGFGNNTRRWNENLTPGIFNSMLGKERFIRQYVQHNPQRLTKLEESDLRDKKYGTENNLENLTGFTTKKTKAKYVSIYNPAIKKGLKKFQVYERIGKEYKRISTLGAFGMSEYSVRDTDVMTLVNNYYKKENASKPIEVKESAKPDVFNITGGNITEILQNIVNHKFTKFNNVGEVAKFLNNISIENIKVEIVDFEKQFGRTNASGVYSNGSIMLDRNYLRRKDVSNDMIAKTVVHELLHAVTADKILKNKDSKEYAQLNLLYNEALRKVDKNKLEQMNQVFDSKTQKLSSDLRPYYGLRNIDEFITYSLLEPKFQELLNVPYKESGKTLFEKLVEIVTNFVNKIATNTDKDTLGYDSIKAVLSFVEANNKVKENSYYANMKQSDQQAESLLDSPFGEVIRPTEEDINSQDLHEPITSSIFDEIFKCKN